jgi:N-acetyl-alpha-D-muramate 1-phosphate uridylyltransferase
MHAMILAAGRGERMRPLTDLTPKPMLSVAGKPLIVRHIERLAQAGITQIIVNHAWLGHQIVQALGDGRQWGVQIQFSAEASALETAGGIARALPLLGEEAFLVINGDIWCDWPLQSVFQRQLDMKRDPHRLAHLVLVDNPAHHPEGDFLLHSDQTVSAPSSTSTPSAKSPAHKRLTFSGIGIYQPALFAGLDPEVPAKLAPLLRQAMAKGAVTGEHHTGRWMDIGTPERLAELEAWPL